MSQEIKSLIENYAKVYADFEKLQKSGELPSGDQKTGVIAEYYAKCYIDKTFSVIAEYAKSGESFDLSYASHSNLIRVQVKGVSAHSKTRIMAPLNIEEVNGNTPFDFLYMISLDDAFRPDGFYINTYEEIKRRLSENNDKRKKIQGAAMKGKNNQGNWLFDFSNNIVEQLDQVIK